MLRRHSLVWLGRPPRCVDASAAVEWVEAGRPFVVCRQRPGEDLSLGFCLPATDGGSPRRLAVTSSLEDIRKVCRPPDLARTGLRPDIVAVWPWKESVPVRLIGSRMWEHLTGVCYTRAESDVDLVVEVTAGASVARVLEFFQRAAQRPGPRVDGEVSFPDRGEVAWRELAGGADHVMLKTFAGGVRLVEREDVRERKGTRAETLARWAGDSLREELRLYPKPGLVSPVDTGSHQDMDHALMTASARCLEEAFCAIAAADRPRFFDELVPLGLAGEKRMRDVTGGVNTHRGALFLLGLLVAAAARTGFPVQPSVLQTVLVSEWGRDLAAHNATAAMAGTHGGRARREAGTGGARQEAAAGFPAIFHTALPCYQKLLADGFDSDAAGVETFFLLLATVEDSNLIHRGGPTAAEFARSRAREFLDRGGVRAADWFAAARGIHQEFVARNLSPGGTADLLAGTLFVHRLSLIPKEDGPPGFQIGL